MKKEIFTVALMMTAAVFAEEIKPVALYDFEKVEGSNVIASAGVNGMICNPGKNAVLVEGRKGGKALQLAGDYKSRGNNGAMAVRGINITEDKLFTLMADLQLTGEEGFREFKEIFSMCDGDRGPGFRCFIYYGSLVFRSGDGSKYSDIGSKAAQVRIPVKRWIRVAAVYDAEKVRLYIDGVKVAEGNAKITAAKTNTLVFGAYRSGYAYPANAVFDNIAVFDKALSDAAIAEDYAKLLNEDVI